MNRITNEQREAIVRKAIAERDGLLSPKAAPAAVSELIGRLDTVAGCCEQGVSEPHDAKWIRMAIEVLRASPPSVGEPT